MPQRENPGTPEVTAASYAIRAENLQDCRVSRGVT